MVYVVPFLLSKFFYSPTNAQVIVLKNNIKIYIKIAPTCFGAVTPSSGSALYVLAKVTLLLKWSIILHRCVIKSMVMWLHMLVVSLLMCVCRTVRK